MLRLPRRARASRTARRHGDEPVPRAALELAAGLEGIDASSTRARRANENLYAADERDLLPRTLLDAIRAFKADPIADAAFGKEMAGIYAKQKQKEWDRHFYAVSTRQLDDMLEFV